MIILYDTTETKFTSNGLGVLDHDIINPVIEESANGTFKLSFDYPLSGICGNRIGRRMYVKADDPDVEGNIFKIYNLEKSDGILSVVAFQVANEFNNNWIEHTNIMGKNGQSALDQMKSNLTNSTRFNFYSDIDSTANSEVVRLNPLTWLIDSSTDNSFVNRWGGEIKRDGFNIRMFKQRGSDNGVQIRWRKNLSSYNVKWDDTTVVTRIRPVGYNGLTLPELYVDSPKLANYGDPIIKEVKYESIKVADENSSSDDNAYKTIDEAYAALRESAAKEFSENHLDDPTVTADVSMISLKNTREYTDVAELETIKPWDTIQLINERDNVDIQMRLNSYKYNPLNHEFTELKFVSVNQSLTSGNTSLSTVINGLSSTVQSVSDTANQAQIAANGKNAINRGAEDPNHLTFNGTLTDGDIYYRQNGDKKEMWIYSAKDKAWKLEVGDMTAQEIADEVAQGKKDADQMRADTDARFEKAEKNIADIKIDMSKTEDDLKSVDAKFDSKTDTLNQSIVQAKSDISDQVDQLKTVKSTADSALKKANGNDSSISTINQNIDKINGKFDLTATKTDIDTVNKKYTQQQAQIDANTKGITLKASQDSVNTLSQTVTSNSSSLSVLSNEVKQKTSKTDFDTLTGRVTNAEQKIDATAEGVTSTVSKVEGLQTQVDNSAVGTNLLINTGQGVTAGISFPSSTSFVRGTLGFGSGAWTYLQAPSSGGWYYQLSSDDDSKNSLHGLTAGQTYILSGRGQLVSSNPNATVKVFYYYYDGSAWNGVYQSTILTPNDSGYSDINWTFTVPNNAVGGYIYFRGDDYASTSDWFGFNHVKLEKGSMATDWCPNPADNATVTALNVVKQTADETYEGLFNKDGSNKIDVTAQGLKAQIETAKESAQGYAKTTIDAKAGEFNASLSSVQTTLQNDATNKANNALKDAKSYTDGKTTAMQTDYNNIISNTSKGFTEKWTAVTKQVQNSAVGNNLLINTGQGSNTGIAHQGATPLVIGRLGFGSSAWTWISAPSSGNWYYQFSTDDDSKNNLHGLVAGQTYTLSGQGTLVSSNSNAALRLFYYYYDGSAWNSLVLVGDSVFPVSHGAFSAFSVTFTIPKNAVGGYIYFRGDNYTSTSDWFGFNSVKLEKGELVTDWCLNFSELATESYAETLINTTAGGITTDLKSYTDAAKNSAVNTASSDATNKANNALNNAKSYADGQASSALSNAKTYADNVTRDTSTEFSKKLTTVTKRVQDSAVGNNLLINTGQGVTAGISFPSSIASTNGSIGFGNPAWTYVYAPSSGYWLYRFNSLDDEQTNLHGLTAGETYTLSGNAMLGSANSAANLWVGLDWYDSAGTFNQIWSDKAIISSPNGQYIYFTFTFTIPIKAVGVGLKFQGYSWKDNNDWMAFNHVKLEKGVYATDWCLNFSELATQSYAETLIDATAGTLQAKVNGADYHNLISMNSNGILLDAHGVNNSNKNIILSGDHIKMDSSNPVTIPNAAITELDAGKLKVGSTLNAANVNLINLNADHISSGTLTGVSFHQASSGHNTWIDGNGVHDYDDSGNNAWIQQGKLQVYNKDGNGFFMDGGKLELTSQYLWHQGGSVKYGLIELDNDVLALGKAGMHIQGYNGLRLDTGHSMFDSFTGAFDSNYTGAAVNLSDDGQILMGCYKDAFFSAGAPYTIGGIVTRKPSVEIGTNSWDNNSTTGRGSNIIMQANGIKFDANGEIKLNANNGDLWLESARINTSKDANALYSGPAGGWWMCNYDQSLAVVHAQSFANSSLLSKKTNITKLDPAHALSLINKTDIYDYQYKNDVENGTTKHYASFIIDDVNEISEYTEPDEFLSEDKTGRDDGTQLAYATLAIQELSKQNEELKTQLDTMQNEISELKKIIKQK
ncbi:MAG: phage tail spike protein [Liquorilactobacillus nagelii]|uniref:phage tail spike protein n=1 Tax=Liquorilactobacillus nagelii TaxID=82688 RepID=UPI0039E8CE26